MTDTVTELFIYQSNVYIIKDDGAIVLLESTTDTAHCTYFPACPKISSRTEQYDTWTEAVLIIIFLFAVILTIATERRRKIKKDNMSDIIH